MRNNPLKATNYFDNKLSFTTGPFELHAMIEKGTNITIIDVRAAEDYDRGHIPGATNLTQGEWGTFRNVSKENNNIFYCYSQQCHLAAKAAFFFALHGYSVIELEGGWQAWRAHGLTVEKRPHAVF